MRENLDFIKHQNAYVVPGSEHLNTRTREYPMWLRLLQAATAGVFLGRAWQHLYWDAPYRALLWDERLMSGPVRWLLGMEWGDFVTDPGVDAGIAAWICATGWFYLLCALAAILFFHLPRLSRPLLLLGGVGLFFLAFLYAKERAYLWAQFFEYSLQVGSPFFLVAAARRRVLPARLVLLMKAATALTFTCHGLFALGVYPTPGYFVEMVMRILGLEQAGAVMFLRVAGGLDLLLSVLLFLPGRWARAALMYAAFWGAATTAARVMAYVDPAFLESTLLQWLHESVMRVPHFLIPLLVFLHVLNEKKKDSRDGSFASAAKPGRKHNF